MSESILEEALRLTSRESDYRQRILSSQLMPEDWHDFGAMISGAYEFDWGDMPKPGHETEYFERRDRRGL